MRNITASTCSFYEDELNCLVNHPQTLPKLISLIAPSVSKLSIEAPMERQLRLQILSEALWILNNLVQVNYNEIDQRLYSEFNIEDILQKHLEENFLPHLIGNGGWDEDHFVVPSVPLEYQELELLKEILWLLANLTNDGNIAFSCATK